MARQMAVYGEFANLVARTPNATEGADEQAEGQNDGVYRGNSQADIFATTEA